MKPLLSLSAAVLCSLSYLQPAKAEQMVPLTYSVEYATAMQAYGSFSTSCNLLKNNAITNQTHHNYAPIIFEVSPLLTASSRSKLINFVSAKRSVFGPACIAPIQHLLN